MRKEGRGDGREEEREKLLKKKSQIVEFILYIRI